MRQLRKVLCWLLCAVILTGAVACAGEKGASGQKVTVREVQQEKVVVTNGKNREKSGSPSDSTSDKVVVENNALRNGWGGLVPPLVERDASLAFDLAKKGVEPDEITKAIQRAHIGPSVGDEYKIHGSAKAGVSAGYGGGGYLESVLKEDKLSINAGFTKVFGWRAEAGYGLDFGPYSIDNFKPRYDYAGNISFGVISIDGTVGEEGVGGGIRIGGGFGASIRQTDNRGSQLPELNGTGGTELISWPIKKEK